MRRLVLTAFASLAVVAGCKGDLTSKLAPGQPVALRGEIATGVECPVLVVKPERRFSLAGDLGRFRVGDRVCVRGAIAQVSMCMAGEATISIVSIAPEDSCP